MIEANDLLRAHVTRVGFDLTLGKTHIAALVYLDEAIRRQEHIPTRVQDLRFGGSGLPSGHLARAFSCWATGVHGCIDRGLVIHHYREDKQNTHPGWHYTITAAGNLVIQLLQEAGIYQEYAAALPAAVAS